MPRGPLETKIRDMIMNLILEQKILPGERLTETMLAEACNISRTPIRSVVREMIAEGLMEWDHPRGFLIPALNSDDVRNVFSVRETLEGRAAYEAATMATEQQTERLFELLSEERKLEQNWSREGFTQSSRDFHLEVATASGNSYLENYVNQCYWRSQIYIFFIDNFFGGAAKNDQITLPLLISSEDEHARIVDRIVNKDPEGAREAMAEHIRATYNWLIAK